MSEAHVIRQARVDEARLLSDLALRSKAHWGYPPEFIECCRAKTSVKVKNMGYDSSASNT